MEKLNQPEKMKKRKDVIANMFLFNLFYLLSIIYIYIFIIIIKKYISSFILNSR